MRVIYIVLLLLFVACCSCLQVTDPKFSFSSQGVETHLVIKEDPNRPASQGIDFTVSLSGAGAPAVTPEEVLSVVGGSVEVKATTNSPASPTPKPGAISGGSRTSSSLLTPVLIGLFGALAGFRFRFVGVLVISIALLMGGSIALQQFDPSWKLTVTATIPSSLSLTTLNVNILRGSVTMVSGGISVSSSVNVDLCDNNGNGDTNLVNFDGASLTLPTGASTFCATKKVIVQNVVIPKSANVQVTSLQDSAFVFVKDTYAGVFSASSKDGYAIVTACENKNMTQSETMTMRGSCGVALVNGTAAANEARVTITAVYDSVFAVAEGISATLRAAKRWSDPATWGGQVPQNGSNVNIDKDQVILLDSKTASLGNVVIRGVLIADTQSEFWMTANTIALYGTLRVGSVYEPYARKGGFTLTGAKGTYASRAPLLAFSNNATSRSILAYPNSKLLMYGALPRRTYTRLSDHAAQNSTLLTVDSVDGWQVGDTIAISPTTTPTTSSSDRRRIVAINAQTRQVTIDAGLSYARWGKLQYATDQGISLTPGVFSSMRAHPDVPDVIDERAVIIHLTRNIVINSVNDSDWQAGHGAHVMWMGVRTQVQLSGVEVHRAGQAGALGRYPLHAHMQSYNMENATSLTSISNGKFVGEATGVFVRNCAVHSSVNRAYTLHGTCGARYENNVAFDIVGHAFFLEDGSEMYNRIIGNVMLNVRRPAEPLRLILSDGASSGFWYTNGNNYFRNNIAGDIRDGFGIWNAFSTRPAPNYVVVSKPNDVTFTFYVDKFKVLLETWTLTSVNESHWSAVGSVSGRQSMMVVDSQGYDNGIINIKVSGTNSAAVGSTIVFNVEGYAGGCFGQSRNVPIWPEYWPMLDYNNNTAFACAHTGVATDNSATDELGSTTGARGFISTVGGVPTPDDHNDPRRVPTEFNGTRLWMNSGGGYANRVYNPKYSRWIATDNVGTDLRGATQNGRLQNSLFVGNSLNNLDPVLYEGNRHAFATYHFSIEFFNISFFNYLPTNRTFITAHHLIDGSGVIESWDLYLNSLEVGPRSKLINWKFFNCAQFERTPPANIEQIYPGNSGGPDAWNRYWTLSGALNDADGALAGRAGDYLVFDVPYFMYNLKDWRRVTPTSRTIATSTVYYGLSPIVADGQRADYAPITFARLNDQTLEEEGTWVIGDGDKSEFFKYMRHASIAKGGIYKVYNHVNPTPNRNRYEMHFYNPDYYVNTSVIVGFPWAGDVPAKVSVWGNFEAVVKTSSFAAMRATPLSYFQDAAANIVWYYHQVLGNGCPVAVVPI